MKNHLWTNNQEFKEQSFYKTLNSCESAMAYFDAVDEIVDLEDPFGYCICYKSIISQTLFCHQPYCLNRELQFYQLELQLKHSQVNRKDNLPCEKLRRQYNSLCCSEFKLFPEDIVGRQILEELFLHGRAVKLINKNSKCSRNKKSRRKQLKSDVAQAEVEFEKARLKKLEEEERYKESQAIAIQPKKKGPKTHFRKSKKPGRA